MSVLIVKGLGICLIVLVAGFLLDRLALWMESRGWIYYRRTKRHTGATIGNALLEVQALLEPKARHVVEERKQMKEEEAFSGDPPDPRGRRVGETGKVVAVSRDDAHGMKKHNQSSIVLLAGLGVEGDAHAGATVKHRARVKRDSAQPNLRQVHLIHAELLDELAARGLDVQPGEMGENVTTSGLDLLGLPEGARLHMGVSAVIEVTGLRDPCSQLEEVQPGLMRATLGRSEDGELIRKAGVMGVVTSGGRLQPGDDIWVELPSEPHRGLGPV